MCEQLKLIDELENFTEEMNEELTDNGDGAKMKVCEWF